MFLTMVSNIYICKMVVYKEVNVYVVIIVIANLAHSYKNGHLVCMIKILE